MVDVVWLYDQATGQEVTRRGHTASVSITRPADTAAYAANDVIGAATGSTAAQEFTYVGLAGNNISITGVELEVDAAALIASEAAYTLHLYSSTPASAYGDNVAWDLPSGDRAAYLGTISLGTPVDLGSTLYVGTNGINKQVKLTSGSTSLFAYVLTAAGYTPTSARVYKITIHTVDL